eukprot:487420-Pelagomonas_calceolata.AAC.1
MTALASGRGASAIREKPVRESSGDVFRDLHTYGIFCSRSLSFQQASTRIRDESYLPLQRAITQKLRPI